MGDTDYYLVITIEPSMRIMIVFRYASAFTAKPSNKNHLAKFIAIYCLRQSIADLYPFVFHNYSSQKRAGSYVLSITMDNALCGFPPAL